MSCLNELSAQQYAFVNFTQEKALPGNQVWSIFQDSKGFMWFSTTAGLIRYDGENHIIYNETNGLTSYFSYNVDEDSKGTVWIGSPAGISKFNIETNHMDSIKLGVFNNSYKVYADTYDRVWIYDFQFPGDVLVYERDSLYNYSYNYHFYKQRIVHIEEDNKGTLFLLTAEGKLFKFFAKQFQEVEYAKPGKHFLPSMFFFDLNGDMILCGSNGVIRNKMSGVNANKSSEILLVQPVSFGLQDLKGDFWFVTQKEGIYRIHDNKVQIITESNGLPTSSLLSIYQDRENNLWIGTNLRGIIKLSSLRLSYFSKKEGFTDEAILAVLNYKGGKYCATEKGLFTFSEPRFKKINLVKRNDVKPFNLTILSIIKYKEYFLLGCVSGLYEFDGLNSVKLLGLEGQIIYNILQDSYGRVWVATNDGVYRWSGGSNFVKQEFGVKDIYVNDIMEVNDKNIYLATSKGLILVENIELGFLEQHTLLFNTENGLPSENILSLTKDKKGNIIIGTTNGLVVKNPAGEFTVIKDGFSNTVIPAVFADSRGRLWAGTNNGLHLLILQNEEYVIRSIFYIKDGLASNEFTRTPTIVEDADGRIWFGSYAGLTVYDPSEEPANFIKPLLYISEIYVNEKLLSDNFTSNQEFHYSENKIRVKYQAPSFFDESNIKFEYFLDPVENPWVNSTNLREITYSFLNPGKYVFKVRAINSFGVVSDSQEWAFVVTPPFWKTIWFYAATVSFLMLSVYLIIKFRLRSAQQNNLRLEKLVKEKTGELQESKNKIAQQYEKLLDAQKQLVEKSQLEKAYEEIELLKDRLTIENIYLKEKQGISAELDSIVGRSALINKIRKQITEVAPTDATVLITGETGTGKNLIAAAIHSLSKRKSGALISVNCAAIPAGLIESELFGHEKGAFTGANERHIGKFEMADASSIFLDEIGDMSLELQSKLLTAIQEKKFSRVGGNQMIQVDTRVIAATNRNLELLVEQGKFRKDLFYRLSVILINIPPLRERQEDIEILTKYFIDRYARAMNKKVKGISRSALQMLLNYKYPGNIRELENIIQRAMILCNTEIMTDEHIVIRVESSIAGKEITEQNISANIPLHELEKRHIIQILNETQWKIFGEDGAANILGMNPYTLRSKMKKLGIPYRKNKI